MKKRKHLPVFLEGYDPIEDLIEWKGKQPASIQAHWELRSYARGMFLCRLTWNLETPDGSKQVASLDQIAHSPEEAAFKVLAEFSKVSEVR